MKINEIINTDHNSIKNSSVDFEVSGCVLIHENQFLILKRHKEKPFGGTWCLPAGKKEPSENPVDTLIREVNEEIGVSLKNKYLPKIGSFHIDLGNSCFIFHVFYHMVEEKPFLNINQLEHTHHDWISFNELEKHNLIISGVELLQICKNFFIERRILENF